MSDFYNMLHLNLIPQISNRAIDEMLSVMRPVMQVGQRRYREIDIDNPRIHRRNQSYLWDAKAARPVRIYHGALSSKSIITFHTYGAPALFKPSLAEVCAGIRWSVKDWRGIHWFYLEACEPMQEKSAGKMMQQGFHIAICTLWGEEETNVIDNDWEEFVESCK